MATKTRKSAVAAPAPEATTETAPTMTLAAEQAPAGEAGGEATAPREPRQAGREGEDCKPAYAAERAPVEGGERRPWPDVTEQKTVSISPNGDALRLLQSKRFDQMQISSDGEIPDWARERLRDAGWSDRVEDEGIYTKQLPPRGEPGKEDPALSSARRRMGFEADRFFEKLANDIRAERQMPPVRLNTAAVAER